MLIAAVYGLVCAVGGLALYRFVELPLSIAALTAGTALMAIFNLRHFLAQRRLNAGSQDRLQKIEAENSQLASRVEQLESQISTVQEQIDSNDGADLLKAMQGLHQMVARLEPSHSPPAAAKTGSTTVLGEVHEALRGGRVELYLQPVVSLPQRHVKFYEGFTRLRRTDGAIIMPDEFLQAADRSGLTSVIDTLLLFRCVEVVRSLAEHNRQIGVFCNIAVSTLEDEMVFPQFLDQVAGDPHIATSLIFEMSMSEFLSRSEKARSNMASLSNLGFRFSLDRAEGLDLDLPRLQAAGIRFTKIETALLLKSLTEEGTRPRSAIMGALAAEDVCPVFRRYGIDLIAEKAEDEKSVIELLELGIGFGQGHVFGTPRPCKESLLVKTRPPTDFLRLAGAA